MNTKLLTKHNLKPLYLKGGCRGSSESTIDNMPHCWKSRVTVHIITKLTATALHSKVMVLLFLLILLVFAAPIERRCLLGSPFL